MASTIILPLEPFKLAKGSHGMKFEGSACVKELQTIAMGEPFSDKPTCVSPIINQLEAALNDTLPNDQRDRLLPFAYRALGTRGDSRDEERYQMCNEWLLHYVLPTLLDKAGKMEIAARLRSLTVEELISPPYTVIHEARREAGNARKAAVEKLYNQLFAELEKRKVPRISVATAGARAAAAVGAAAAAVPEAMAEAVVEAGRPETVALVQALKAAAEAAAARIADDLPVELVQVHKAYWGITNRIVVRRTIYAKHTELFNPTSDDLINGVFDILDRMLPPTPLEMPVIENAGIIFGVIASV